MFWLSFLNPFAYRPVYIVLEWADLCGKVVMNAYLRLAVFGLWDGQCSIQFC
jgi:hypothetical protein